MELFGSNLFSRKREAAPGIPATTDPSHATNKSEVKGGTYAENIVYVTQEERALRIATFHRCASLVANAMAQMLPQYQQLNAAGGNFVEYNRGVWRTLNYLMQQEPNPQQSAFEMWQQAMLNIIFKGNAYILIQRDVFGVPEQLWLATSGQYDQLNDRYVLTFSYMAQQPWTVVADAVDVIHFANTFRKAGSRDGISTLQFARDMLTLSATLDKQSLDTAAKGGRLKMLIGEEKPAQGVGTLAYGMMDKKEMDRYAKELNDKVYVQDIVAMRGLDKAINVSMTAADMQLFDQRQFGVAEICRLMDVPRTLAMDGSNSSYKTPEADRLDFLMNSIQPKRRQWENELNRKLVSAKDFGRARIHLCELPLMMFDKKGQAEIDLMHLQTGWSINDIRGQYDMPTVESGDEPMASANLMTLKALLAKSEAATQLKPGNYTVGNEPPKGEE